MAGTWIGRAAGLVVASGAPLFALDHTEKHVEHGFSLGRPLRFEARPVPPDEGPDLVAVYAPKDAPDDRRAPVTHSVFKVEGLTSTLDVQRWVLQTLRPLELKSERSVRSRYGRHPVRFTGSFFDSDGAQRSLFVHGWMGEADAVVFVGECEPDRLRREKRTFERVSTSFRFFTEASRATARRPWERRYRNSALPHREERIEIATDLVEGWSVTDTEHSIVLYHGPSNAPVLAQIADDLVALRARLTRDFPPDRPIDALSVVRVCRDRGEYLTYGGNPATVGHFNPRSQELVLYDGRADTSRPMPRDHPALDTLYHEAVHQFLYHTASALSPHSWYDEGTAEYYSGSVMDRGRVATIEMLDERMRFLRRELPGDRIPALRALLEMTQEEFYANADINYSLGYAFVSFLKTAERAGGNARVAGLHTRYFDTLRRAWRLEAEGLALSGLSGPKYFDAIDRARSKALEAALDGVDLGALEARFLEWIRTG